MDHVGHGSVVQCVVSVISMILPALLSQDTDRRSTTKLVTFRPNSGKLVLHAHAVSMNDVYYDAIYLLCTRKLARGGSTTQKQGSTDVHEKIQNNNWSPWSQSGG